ncbi:MAG: hypothetical protein V1726_03455 [Methanobacteriota archaeon]
MKRNEYLSKELYELPLVFDENHSKIPCFSCSSPAYRILLMNSINKVIPPIQNIRAIKTCFAATYARTRYPLEGYWRLL